MSIGYVTRATALNTTRVIHKLATDGQQLSDAEIEGRRQLRQIWQVLREEIPIFRNSQLLGLENSGDTLTAHACIPEEIGEIRLSGIHFRGRRYEIHAQPAKQAKIKPES